MSVTARVVSAHNRSRRTSSEETSPGANDHDAIHVFEPLVEPEDPVSDGSPSNSGEGGASGDPQQDASLFGGENDPRPEEGLPATDMLLPTIGMDPDRCYGLNVFAEAELNEYMVKKTDAMIFFVISVAFGNAAHIRTLMGLSQVSGNAITTKKDFGDMVVGRPTLLVLHGFCLFFMCVACILLIRTRKIVVTNRLKKNKCQTLNGYTELLVGSTIALNLVIAILSGPEKWFESVMMAA